MKRLKSFLSSLFALIMVLSANVACKDYEHQGESSALSIHISNESYTHRTTRAVYTQQEEDNIQTLTVLFVDNSGNFVKYADNVALTYKFDSNVTFGASPTWKNNSESTKTLVLKEVQYRVMRDVYLMVVANIQKDVYNKINNKQITTKSELDDAVNQTLEEGKANQLQKPFLMVGNTDSFTWTGEEDKEVYVELKRAIAKIQVVVHYDWDKLLYNGNSDTNADRITMKDFNAETHFAEKEKYENKVNSGELKFESFDAANKTATYTFYINEYNIKYEDILPPYLLLKLKSVNEEEYSLASGNAPISEDNILNNYYRLVFPRVINRNHSYTLHAYISEAGSDGEDGARTLHFSLTVAPWEVDNMNFAPGYLRADFAPWIEGDNL